MLRQGPISVAAHGAAEYPLAALLIAAPFLFGFSDESAPTAISIVAGVLVLLAGASTRGFPTAVVKVIPLLAHAAGDLAAGVFFIAAPFLFGFTDEGAATAFFIAAGVLVLLVTLATRWRPAEAATARSRT